MPKGGPIERALEQFARQSVGKLVTQAKSNIRGTFKKQTGRLEKSIKGTVRWKRDELVVEVGSTEKYGNMHNTGGLVKQVAWHKKESELKHPRRRPLKAFRSYKLKKRAFMNAEIAIQTLKPDMAGLGANLQRLIEDQLKKDLK